MRRRITIGVIFESILWGAIYGVLTLLAHNWWGWDYADSARRVSYIAATAYFFGRID